MKKKQFVEPQPSQEPKDDGEELGPCGCLKCEGAKVEATACLHCPINSENMQYSEEDYC